MDKAEHLIILEDILKERFDYLCNKYGIKQIKLMLRNNYSGNMLINLLYRVLSKGEIDRKYRELKELIKKQGISRVFVSNAEGYVASNILTRLNEDFPELTLIALQHGIFVPDYRSFRESLKRKINYITYRLLRFKLLGEGFGNRLVDKYIVYNDMYRDHLLGLGWKAEDIIVDLYFLKCYFYDMGRKYRKSKNIEEVNIALFFTQDLCYSRFCSRAEEALLNKKVIDYLSRKYNKVIIKIHPSNKVILSYPLPSNCYIEYNILHAMIEADVAYSFFSTALIDADIFGLYTVAMKSRHIKVDNSIYLLFKRCIDIDEL